MSIKLNLRHSNESQEPKTKRINGVWQWHVNNLRIADDTERNEGQGRSGSWTHKIQIDPSQEAVPGDWFQLQTGDSIWFAEFSNNAYEQKMVA